MKNWSSLLFIAIMALSSLNIKSQSSLIGDPTPRLAAYGDAWKDLEADVIVAYLNVWDASYSEMDPLKLQNMQRMKIDQIGLRNYMSNPTYEGLKTAPMGSAIELKFPSKASYEEAMTKASSASDENVVVSIDFSFADVSPLRKQQALDGLITEAVGNAKKQAEKMANASGVRLGSIIYVEEMPNYNVYGYNDEGYGGYSGYSVRVSTRILLHYEIVK